MTVALRGHGGRRKIVAQYVLVIRPIVRRGLLQLREPIAFPSFYVRSQRVVRNWGLETRLSDSKNSFRRKHGWGTLSTPQTVFYSSASTLIQLPCSVGQVHRSCSSATLLVQRPQQLHWYKITFLASSKGKAFGNIRALLQTIPLLLDVTTFLLHILLWLHHELLQICMESVISTKRSLIRIVVKLIVNLTDYMNEIEGLAFCRTSR